MPPTNVTELFMAAGFRDTENTGDRRLVTGNVENGLEWSVEITDTSTGGPPERDTVIFKGVVAGSGNACDLSFESSDPRDMVALVVAAANAVSFGILAIPVDRNRGFTVTDTANGATVFIHNPFAETERGDWSGTREGERDFVLDSPSLRFGAAYANWLDDYCRSLTAEIIPIAPNQGR